MLSAIGTRVLDATFLLTDLCLVVAGVLRLMDYISELYVWVSPGSGLRRRFGFEKSICGAK